MYNFFEIQHVSLCIALQNNICKLDDRASKAKLLPSASRSILEHIIIPNVELRLHCNSVV